LINVLILGVMCSAINVAATRQFGAKGTWFSWAALVLLFDAVLCWRLGRFPALVEDKATAVYTLLAFTAIPAAFSAWFISRKARGAVRPGAIRHVLSGLAGFGVGLPIGLILGAIPDAARMF
jgi:hypothetical protein